MLNISDAERIERKGQQILYVFGCKNSECPKLIKKTKYYCKTSSGYCKHCFSKFKHKKPKDTRKTKTCKECDNTQDIKQFQLRETGHRRNICKGCINLRRVFKINLNDYNKLLKKQNNVCGICKKPEVEKHQNGRIRKLAVDHCHKSGKIRGLLCAKCNQALGKFRDNIEYLNNAINYLKDSYES